MPNSSCLLCVLFASLLSGMRFALLTAGVVDVLRATVEEFAACNLVNDISEADGYAELAEVASTCDIARPTPALTETEVDLVFVRHAQSMWNVQEEAGKIVSILSAAAAFTENALGSNPALKDAPLSPLGIQQVQQLHEWIQEAAFGVGSEWQRFLAGDGRKNTKVAFATSNLRRAALTLLIAFSDQVSSGLVPHVHVLSALQELSMGIDSHSLTAAGQRPAFSIARHCPFSPDLLRTLFKPECNRGNELSLGRQQKDQNPVQRFCNWALHQTQRHGKDTFVIVGHSHWFRELMQDSFGRRRRSLSGQFLDLSGRDFGDLEPNSLERNLTEEKLGNANVVSLKLRIGGERGCHVVPRSTQRVFPPTSAEMP